MGTSTNKNAYVSVLITTWPNLISLSRLLSLPVIIWLVLADHLTWAFWTMIVAGLSDAVDGYVARILKTPSKVGAYLDPLADKVLLVGLFVLFGYKSFSPTWLVLLVVFRDVMILGGIVLLFIFHKKIKPHPHMISKINTVLQILYIVWVLAQKTYFSDFPAVTNVLILLTATTTILSAFVYMLIWLEHFAQPDQK
jgi:cardiolipin synthase